jgi:hypothetical protein
MKFATTLLALACVTTQTYAQEREWVLDAASEDVFMIFGVASANDVGVSFWCKAGEKQISIFAPLPTNTPTTAEKPTLDLKINRTVFNLKARLVNNLGAMSIEAALVPQDQLVDLFQTAQSFSLTYNGHKVAYPLEGADFPSLVTACNTPLQEPTN